MFKRITTKNEYLKAIDVSKLPITYEDKIAVNLFGNEIKVERDPWLWHCHLKITNACQARCKFCVEQNTTCKENATLYIQCVDEMLTEMERAGILFSVSLTGGEPTLFPKFKELCEVLSHHKIHFLTMNTNGGMVLDYLPVIDGLFDFINISRHSIDDNRNYAIFGTTNIPDIAELKLIKRELKQTKMRIQCVMYEINSLKAFKEFTQAYDFADDISFRRLMKLPDEFGIEYDTHDDIYEQILEYAFDTYELKEQTIQDYYVYEIWNNGATDITFSYANMDMLSQVEEQEANNICREFIVHPNGTIAGSWIEGHKVIKAGFC